MMYCCDVLKGWISGAGEKGISVLARSEDEIRSFYLQARACDKDKEDLLKNIPKDCQIPRLGIVMQMGIQYCPFCGTLLKSLIGLHEEEFDALAKAHESLLL